MTDIIAPDANLTAQQLRELARVRGLALSDELTEKLLPLVTDLLALARGLAQSEIWKSQSSDPLNSQKR